MIQLLSALLVVASASKAPQVELFYLDGTRATGALVQWNSVGLAVELEAGVVEIRPEQVLRIRFKPVGEAKPLQASDQGTFVELRDGTRIRSSGFLMRGRTATIASPLTRRSVDLDASLIRLVELQPPSESTTAAVDELENRDAAGDALVVTNRAGDSADYLTGVVGDVTEDQVQFTWDGESIAIKLTKVAAIGFFQERARETADAICQLKLADGTRIAVSTARLEGEWLHLTTPSDVKMEVAVVDLREADFSAGKVVYLSDLNPVVAKFTPRIGAPLSETSQNARSMPRRDKAFSGSSLSLAWAGEEDSPRRDVRTYDKGLALRSRTEVSYRLPVGMRRFVAMAGIDPATADQGHVVLEVRADDRVVWVGEISGSRAPMEIDVELNEARQLHLLVDYGKNLDFGDRLHLIEARIIK